MNKTYTLVRYENDICCSCNKPISFIDLERGLYMPIKGGKIIHWNCSDATIDGPISYVLYDDETLNNIVATSDKKDDKRLSISNCDEVITPYDVHEYATQYASQSFHDKGRNDLYDGFIAGFLKRQELTADKKFSIDDIAGIVAKFLNDFKNMKYKGDEVSIINQLLRTLRQDKYQVEIELETEDNIILKRVL